MTDKNVILFSQELELEERIRLQEGMLQNLGCCRSFSRIPFEAIPVKREKRPLPQHRPNHCAETVMHLIRFLTSAMVFSHPHGTASD